MLSQTSFDTSTGDLITGIQRAFELILQNRSLSKINSSKNLLVEIAQVIQESSQFIMKYSATKKFCVLVILVFSITLSCFRRVFSPEECSLRDSH